MSFVGPPGPEERAERAEPWRRCTSLFPGRNQTCLQCIRGQPAKVNGLLPTDAYLGCLVLMVRGPDVVSTSSELLPPVHADDKEVSSAWPRLDVGRNCTKEIATSRPLGRDSRCCLRIWVPSPQFVSLHKPLGKQVSWDPIPSLFQNFPLHLHLALEQRALSDDITLWIIASLKWRAWG